MKIQTHNGLAVLPVLLRKQNTQELPSPLGQNLAKLASAFGPTSPVRVRMHTGSFEKIHTCAECPERKYFTSLQNNYLNIFLIESSSSTHSKFSGSYFEIPKIFLVASTQRLERLHAYHLNISGKFPTFLEHGLGGKKYCQWTSSTHSKYSDISLREILNLARTQRKGMLFESYSHLNISGKYPKCLAHGLECFLFLTHIC